MEKKAVSGIILTLLLTSMLMLAFDIQPLRAGANTTGELAKSSSSSYDRQAAYDYAQRYWDKVCSDGYFWDSPSTYISLPIGTDITSMTGYDCAHFVSCCIGSESNEQGGGLNVPSRVPPTYGEPGAARLGDWLISSGNGVEKTSITELARGDVINYDWDADSHWDHIALYLGNGKVAAHTACVWETDWQLGGAANYRFIHIKGTWGKSQNVAVIDDYYGSAVGYLYPSDYPDQTFSTLSASQVSAEKLASYDTVNLFMFNPSSLTVAQKAAMNDWVYKGGKLIIWDSDQVPRGSPWDYTWLPYPFTTSVPGQTGARTGHLEVIEGNELSSSDLSSSYYIDTSILTSQTDAVGDANVLVTYSPGWHIDMMATNVLGETGPAHVYAAFGSGLIIYSALDWDYAGYSISGGEWLKKLLKQELECSYLPFAAPPVPEEVGLIVDVTPKTQGPYHIGDTIEFEVTVANPTDTTGINLNAKDVKLTVIEPPEIKIEVGWFGVTYANIAPGETKSASFKAEAIEAGDSIEIKVNAIGWTSLGPIGGSGSCHITSHDPEAPKPDWSFAIIADPHIGYRISDYDGEGWEDSEPLPQECNYEATDWLDKIVKTIIMEKDYYNIEFVGVLGDFADTAEKSEFFKAKEILNKLNDAGIPYIPVIGDHDQWPYIQKEGVDSDDRFDSVEVQADHAYGDTVFKEIFWDNNQQNVELLKGLDGLEDWTETEKTAHISGSYNFFHVKWPLWESERHIYEYDQDVHPQNYAFTFNGINYFCLDFNPRMKEPGDDRGFLADCYNTPHGIYGETKNFLEDYLRSHTGRATIILSHHPLETFGGFPLPRTNEIREIVKKYNCDYKTYNFGGHVHYSYDIQGVYDVIATEAVNEKVPALKIHFLGGEREGKPIRIVQVNNGEIDYSTLLKPLKEVPIKWPVPIFTYTYASYPEPNKEIIFTAHFTSYHGFKTSFYWDFGDGTFGSGSSVKHTYAEEGEYDVILTVTTKNLITGEETSQIVTRLVYVHSKHLISPLPPNLHATSLLTEEDLTEVPENVWQPVLIARTASEAMPVAELGVHFEEATEDIDLSALVADVDLEEAKSVIYMPSWPEEIDESKQLFIPSTGAGTVYICLDATSLEEVSLENADVIINVGETKDRITVTTTLYNGREYYMVSGVAGTGGGELEIIPATVDFNPDTLNLKSEGKWVTVYIELPEGYDVSRIDVSSIMLNNTVPALEKPTEIGDYDGDGIPDLMVKFDRASVIALFDGKTVPENYVIEVTGTVADIRFKGTDIIRVISPP